MGVLAAFWFLGFGYAVGRLARRCRRPASRWFLYGAVLGPLGIRMLQAAPPGTCGTCLSPVVGWSFACPFCASDVRDTPVLGRQRAGAMATLRSGRPTPGDPGAPAGRPPMARPAPNDAFPGGTRGTSIATPTTSGAARRRPAQTESVAPGPVLATPAEDDRQPGRGAPKQDHDKRSRRHARTAVGPGPVGGASAWTEPADRAAAGTARLALAPVAAPYSVTHAPTTSVAVAVAPAAPAADLPRPRLLASAVFVEGSEPLQPGLWYQVTIFGEELRISGQANALPDHQVVSRRLREIHLAAHDSRLVITGATKRLAGFYLVFTSVREGTSIGLSRELDQLAGILGADGATR